MKMINKILLTIALIILSLLVGNTIYFYDFAEVTQAPVSISNITQEIPVKDFTGITNKRGLWKINIEPADTFSVAIHSGDNIIDNFLDITVHDSMLTLNLSEEFEYENTALLQAYINIPELKSISANNRSIYFIKNIKSDKLNIRANDVSLTVIDSSNFNVVNLAASGRTSVIFTTTLINNFEYRLSQESITACEVTPDKYAGNISDQAVLEVKDISFFSSEYTPELSKLKIPIFPKLPIVNDEKKLTDYMQQNFNSVKYDYEMYYSEDSPYIRIFMSHLGRMTPKFSTYGYKGGKVFGEAVEDVGFLYTSGILSRLSIFFNAPVEYERLSDVLTNVYGKSTKRENFDRFNRESWENVFNGIDSTCSIFINGGEDKSVLLVVNFKSNLAEQQQMMEDWSYYCYPYTGPFFNDKLEKLITQKGEDLGSRSYKNIPLFWDFY